MKRARDPQHPSLNGRHSLGLDEVEQLSDLLAQSGDLDAALQRALEFVLARLGCMGGLLLIEQPDGSGPLHLALCGLPPEWEAQLAIPDSPLRQAAAAVTQSGQPLASDIAWGLAAALPVAVPQARLGALLLHGPAGSVPDLEGVSRLARCIARAIRIHHFYADAQGRGQELAALNKIAAALTSTLQLDEILTSTIEGIRQVLNVEAGSLLLLDEDRGELIFKNTLSGEPDWIFQYSLQVGHGLVGECVRSGQPLLVNDVLADSRFYPELDGVTGFEARSVLCAPLLARGQILGALEVINKRDGQFDLHDQDLLVSMTASVANAIYNARLFHQLTVANADLEASRWEVIRSRSTLQALFDGLPDPIYIVDRECNLVAANLACARLAGREVEAMLGQRCHLALFGQDERCANCQAVQTLDLGQSTHYSERRVDKNNQITEWNVRTYPIRDDNSQVLQAIFFRQDVTEQHRLEAWLAQAEKLAAVGQLAAGVAHEINNPLAAIIANTQLLERDMAADDDRRESLELIALAGERALSVVRNLLDFARQDRYELAPTDVNASLRSALALVEHQMATHSIRLESELMPDLPMLHASHDHLQGVWLNMLLNARDALGGQGGDIRVATRQQGSEVHVTISDTGMGIAPERVTRIFEPFYTTKDPGRGTGLGLSVCHRIVKQHGGHIVVDSQVGRGTTFTVILPVAGAA